MGAGDNMLKPRITARQLIWISAFLLMLTILMMTWSTLRQQESTLAIRAVNQGASMPDGFSVLHHLDANGIHLKALRLKMTCCSLPSIPLRKAPQQKQCLIKRYHGYVVAQQDDDNETVQWLSRLRESSHRFG